MSKGSVKKIAKKMQNTREVCLGGKNSESENAQIERNCLSDINDA